MDRGTVGSAQSGRLLVEVRQEGSSAVVTPAGELDHHTADLLREPLEDCLAKGKSRLVVDCTRLEFCDSTGLNVLLGARLKAEAAGRVAVPVPWLAPRSSPPAGLHRVSHPLCRTYVRNGGVFYRSARAGDIRTDCSVSDHAVTF
jgi:anti-anti-sigma factor